MVALIELLLGKGYQLTIFDKNVNEAKNQGTNNHYLVNYIPHISKLMVNNMDEVIKKAKTIVIGNKAKEFKNILSNIADHHVIIDLVRILNEIPTGKQYHGICW